MKMESYFLFSCLVLEFCPVYVKNGPFLWIYTVSKKYTQTILSLLININASQALQCTFAETDIVFRVLGYWHFVL